MDELWQRYRNFWTPLLIGLGVLLLGLIAVYVVNDDPDEAQQRVDQEGRRLQRMVQPTPAQVSATRENAAAMRERVEALARRLDQTGLAKDPVEDAAAAALTAAILRGGGGEAAFEGDAAAAASARARYERALRERMDSLRSGDPNVGFGTLRDAVWTELRLRANRADVDLNAEQLGFTAVASVNRATLLQRLLNLALVARVVDVAVRSGVRSVDDVRFDQRATGGPDAFLQEWPVTIQMTGTMDALRPVLESLAGPARATPLLAAGFAPPRRALPGQEGQVEMTLTLVSLRVVPDARLDLAAEEEVR